MASRVHPISTRSTGENSEASSPASDGSETTPVSESSSIESPPLTTDSGKPILGNMSSARAKAASLSLDEQVSLLRAADFWRTVAIPSRAIPSIKTSDGPNGARGGIFIGGTKAALFPCGISLAATWNTDLIYEVGQHLADEVKARSAQVLLAPTVCMHRGPLGGRNFESFSEDPYLTGKLATSYIRGIQSKGIAATIKHFVGNEQETQRLAINSIIAERPLRELYLKPFEMAIRDANPWAVMSSYNLINGTHADMHEHTLKTILRGEWRYDGLVMSDWGGTNSVAESIEAGCDVEMPISDKWRGEKAIAAVRSGKLSKSSVERAAANVLRLVERTKGSDMSPEAPEREDDRPETRELIRRAGVEGLTLLKNEGNVLPIKEHETKIAVIGPNANRAIAGGGGSASLNPYYNTLPLDSIRNVPGKEVTYAVGCTIYKWLPVASPYCTNPSGDPGVTIEWYKGDSFQGSPTVVQHRTNTDLFLWDSAPEAEVSKAWSARIKTILTPKTSGTHTLSFMSVGPGRLFVNGKQLVDLWDWTQEGEAMFNGSEDVLVDISAQAGVPITLLAEINSEVRPLKKKEESGVSHGNGGCRIGYLEKSKGEEELLQEAVEMSREADVAVLVVGLDAEWESEGYDRRTMDLPSNGSQDRLIEAVLGANPKTVVVNQSGSPVTMPWADRAPAILQAWYQGQEAGNALADVLFGTANPSGKLPTTFPKRLEDNPSFHNWPGENGDVVYGEGVYIGYRHYERVGVEPLFAFGHGLSYTRFEYGEVVLDRIVLGEEGSIEVSVSVVNAGEVGGMEIVQVYVKDVKSRLLRPEKELQGFAKVDLRPGEMKVAKVVLDKYSVGYWDTKVGKWIAEEGVFEVKVGASSQDIRGTATFEVGKSFTWIF